MASKIKLTLGTLLIFFLGLSNSFAETKFEDVIHLKNGEVKRGVIISQVPNEAVMLKTTDGAITAIKVADIEKIVRVETKAVPIGTDKTTSPIKNQKPASPRSVSPNMNIIKEDPIESIKMSGPRVGLTFLTGRSATPRDEGGEWDYPMITQIGWQFESRFFTTEGGLTGLTEIVPLVGGIDQNKFKPSVSFLFGARTDRGNEFAVGPLVSLPVSSDDNINTSFIFAFGMTKRQGNIFFPINIAVIPHKDGTRFTLTVGWNMSGW